MNNTVLTKQSKKGNKRFIALLAGLLAIVFCSCIFLGACDKAEESNSSNSAADEKLVVYNWEDYIDKSLLDEFAAYYEEVTGASLEITYSTFETNETMLTKVLRNDANVDLICPSEYAIEKLIANDKIYKLTDAIAEHADTLVDADGNQLEFDLWGNTDPNIIRMVKDEFAEIGLEEYMVPYMWGTLGILYNADIITEEDLAEGWGLLWNTADNENLDGKILMKDSVRDSYVAVMMYLYYNVGLPEPYASMDIQVLINTIDDTLMGLAEAALKDQRSHLAGYEVDFGKDDVINEFVYADLAWSGDALWAIEESESVGVNLDYFVPEDSGNVWFDGWVMPKSVKNMRAALMFMEYMNDPDNGIWNAFEIGYTSAIDAEKLKQSDVVWRGIEDYYEIEEYYNEGCENGDECEDGCYCHDYPGLTFDYNEDDELIITEDLKAALSDIFFADSRRYPTDFSKLGVMRDFGRNNDSIVMMWERVKVGADIPWASIIALCVSVGVILLGVGAYALRRKFAVRSRKVADKK